ncbi:MAG: putative 4-hydroxybenzoate polyprenyltransferase [Chitinophagaceae bacterium]|nr:putative 4-hydroxybenzoate polyprenyltransferase [Chitinophagaceae bacterium]
MSAVKNYLSLIKFSHTVFALPFALIGFFLALVSGTVDWVHNLNNTIGWGPKLTHPSFIEFYGTNILAKFILILLCMVFARSAAMAFNRYLDRSFDAQNPRTAIREIPAGIIRANSALLFTIIMSALFIITTYFINTLCFALSPVAMLVVLGYSFTKRFTPLCHLVLGLGLSLAPIGAFLAVTGKFELLPILFSFTVLFWVSGFDIIYALQDEEFDKKYDLKSIPAWLGKSKALRVSELLHVLSALCIITAGLIVNFGIWYWAGVIFFTGLLIYQHLLVKPNDLSKVNMAFFTTNGIASVVFAVFVIIDIIL